jgi:hypothetical protein
MIRHGDRTHKMGAGGFLLHFNHAEMIELNQRDQPRAVSYSISIAINPLPFRLRRRKPTFELAPMP